MSQREKKQDYNEAYNQAWPSWGLWQSEAKKDIQAYLGDIFTAEEKKRLRLRNSDVLNIQLIRRLIKWVAGFQVDHRKGIKYDPVEGGDDITAGDMTEIAIWAMQHNGGYGIISKAFEHALKTGLSLVNIFNDSNGDTSLDHLFYNQFVIDPNFARIDLKDCRYGIIRKFISKSQAKILLPQRFHERIDAIDDEMAVTDGKFPNYTTPIVHGRKLLAIDEFQERTTDTKIVIINRKTGREQIWNGTRAELDQQLQLIVQQTGADSSMFSTVTRTIDTVDVSVFFNGVHFATARDPFKLQDLSFTPIWCYYDPEYDRMDWKLQGFVRGLKEIQRAESKRIIAEIASYENAIGAGLDFEEGALVDEEDAFVTGHRPRKFVEGALSSKRVRDRQLPIYPPGNLNLHQVLEDAMPKTIGITPEMLGLIPEGTREQISGLVNQMRIGQGTIGLRTVLGDLDSSQNSLGGKLQKLIQRYPISKLRRILGREPSKQFQIRKFGKYDSATSNAPLTNAQRKTHYQELITLLELGAKVGKPFPAEWTDLLETGALQVSGKQLQKIKQREQLAIQQTRRQIQQQNQLQDVTIKALMAQIQEDETQAVERKTKAMKNLTASELDKAKTAEKLDSIDTNKTANLINAAVEVEKLEIERQKLTLPIQGASK